MRESDLSERVAKLLPAKLTAAPPSGRERPGSRRGARGHPATREGGATPIADCRGVFGRIDPAERERFTEKRWMYVRNFVDGSPIEPEVLEHLRECYRQETVSFPWERGDVLMLDDMLAAHGRDPYRGERKILVGMAEPVTRAVS